MNFFFMKVVLMNLYFTILISREATLQGLMEVDGGDSALPFVRQFYCTPSMYLLVDR